MDNIILRETQKHASNASFVYMITWFFYKNKVIKSKASEAQKLRIC